MEEEVGTLKQKNWKEENVIKKRRRRRRRTRTITMIIIISTSNVKSRNRRSGRIGEGNGEEY